MKGILYDIEPGKETSVVLNTLFQSMRWMDATEIADYLAYTSLTFEEIQSALLALHYDRKIETSLYIDKSVRIYRWRMP